MKIFISIRETDGGGKLRSERLDLLELVSQVLTQAPDLARGHLVDDVLGAAHDGGARFWDRLTAVRRGTRRDEGHEARRRPMYCRKK